MLMVIWYDSDSGHKFRLRWFANDAPEAEETVVNWWRDELMSSDEAIEMIETVKRMTDAEHERVQQSSPVGRTGHTQGRFVPRAGGGV